MDKKPSSSLQDLINKGLNSNRDIFEITILQGKDAGDQKQEMSVGEYKAFNKKNKPKKNKFNNKPVWYKGVRYPSTKECNFAKDLDWKLKAGQIKSWERQIHYDLAINDIHICRYDLDFEVVNNDDSLSHYDTKGCTEGTVYSLFCIKKKLMKICHNIDVIEK